MFRGGQMSGHVPDDSVPISVQMRQHFVGVRVVLLLCDASHQSVGLLLRAAASYSSSGHRTAHAGARPGDIARPDIVLGDDRDSAGPHQSATAAALSAAAAVRKSCLGGSHASTPWRPQGKSFRRHAPLLQRLRTSSYFHAASTPLDIYNNCTLDHRWL